MQSYFERMCICCDCICSIIERDQICSSQSRFRNFKDIQSDLSDHRYHVPNTARPARKSSGWSFSIIARWKRTPVRWSSMFENYPEFHPHGFASLANAFSRPLTRMDKSKPARFAHLSSHLDYIRNPAIEMIPIGSRLKGKTIKINNSLN